MSLYDDGLLYVPGRDGRLLAVIAVHVDDLLVMASKCFRDHIVAS